ncbi:hypothetical protein D3C72_2177390 [compost metagenome]
MSLQKERDREGDNRSEQCGGGGKGRNDCAGKAQEQCDQKRHAEAGNTMCDVVDRADLLHDADIGDDAGNQENGGPTDLVDRSLLRLR